MKIEWILALSLALVPVEGSAEESLDSLRKKKERLELESELIENRRKIEIAQLQAAKERLELEHEIEKLQAQREAAKLTAEKERLALEAEKVEAANKLAVAELELEARRLELRNNALEEKVRETRIKLEGEQAQYDIASARIAADMAEIELKRERYQESLNRLETELEIRERQDEFDRRVNGAVTRTPKPFRDGILRVSDRRIPLNGPIIEGTADFVTNRIHFFNNKSPVQPIFIVIDRCPGGSVMEGYRILKAMEASDAPIHVVVKSFAASMAAVILTLAEESYAYPNAIILHHQPSTLAAGNVTQQTEELKVFREWAERLHTPVAKRMGISLDAFYKRMYEQNSRGDWQEFADQAQAYKWVDHVVSEIREEGIEIEPEDEAPSPFFFFFAEDGTPKGQAAPSGIQLPTPSPFDFYFLYNRHERYRWW